MGALVETESGIVISQHVCEHWNYRVCFIENGKCKNCGWKTPELEAKDKEIALVSTGPTGFSWLDSNWINFWLRLELLFSNLKATSKEEFLEYQNIINECMEIENSAVVLPPENFYRSCRRFGDNQW